MLHWTFYPVKKPKTNLPSYGKHTVLPLFSKIFSTNYWRKRKNLIKNFTLATPWEKRVSGAKRSKIFQNKKFESLAFQELVNHSCLGEGECPHPFEEKSDQKFQNKDHRLFFRRKFLKTGGVSLQIFSFVQKSCDQPTTFNNYSKYIWEYWQKISQWSKENFRRYVHLF